VTDIARFFKARGHVVRFIEFMDVGTVNEWSLDGVFRAEDILEAVARELPMEPVARERESDVALRYRYLDDGVEVGAIASISQPFCGACTRARLSSKGELFTCLFGSTGTDLRSLLRSGADDGEIEEAVRTVWSARTDRYSEERIVRLGRGDRLEEPKVEMFRIGG